MAFTGLESVREGMRVIDADEVEVGTVSHIELARVDEGDDAGEPTATTDQAVAPPVPGPGFAPGGIGATTAATGPPGAAVPGVHTDGATPGPMPEEEKQLRRSGYVTVETGLLHRDVRVQPDQVHDVTDQTITLNTTKDQLHKGS